MTYIRMFSHKRILYKDDVVVHVVNVCEFIVKYLTM